MADLAFVLGVLVHQDDVAHDHAQQRDETQHRREADGEVGDPQPDDGAEQAQRHRGHDHQRDAELAEVDEDEEENDHQ